MEGGFIRVSPKQGERERERFMEGELQAESAYSFERNKEVMERVRALESVVQRMQVDQKARDEWSSQQLHSVEKQLSSSASSSLSSSPMQRSPRLAYSSSFKKPEVPSVFQMPLHYPKYSKADYDSMPEWKLDRLLEEYGLPVMGSLRDKKQYAIGVFLWN